MPATPSELKNNNPKWVLQCNFCRRRNHLESLWGFCPTNGNSHDLSGCGRSCEQLRVSRLSPDTSARSVVAVIPGWNNHNGSAGVTSNDSAGIARGGRALPSIEAQAKGGWGLWRKDSHGGYCFSEIARPDGGRNRRSKDMDRNRLDHDRRQGPTR